MGDRQLEAAAQLADLLDQENAALRRLDYPQAAALVPAKVKALEALTKGSMCPVPGGPWQRLGELAAENQVLLEEAMAVQTRIVMIVARASAPPSPAVGYNGYRCGPPSARSAAMAVLTRA
jgi:hypothetical protein